MAITQVSDIFDPQVVGDLTTDILFKMALLINSPAVVDASDQIYAEGGNTVTFPSWDTNVAGIVQDQVTTRTGVTPSKITMSTYNELVEDKIVSFDANKNVFRDISRKANPNLHMAELVARESRQTIQLSLIGKALGTPLVDDASYVSGTAAAQTLTVDGILNAKMAWGEYAAGVTPMLFCHSDQFTALAKTEDFKRLGTATTNNAIVNAAAVQGAVAMVHGVLIYTLDSIIKRAPTVSEITRSSTTATLTTAAAHGYKVGDRIVVSGATQTEYNGTQVITDVPTATTLTFEVSGSPATPATGSPAIAASFESLMCLPGALGLVPRQGVEHKVVQHAGSQVLTFDWDLRFVTTLLRVAPRGVVRFRTR